MSEYAKNSISKNWSNVHILTSTATIAIIANDYKVVKLFCQPCIVIIM